MEINVSVHKITEGFSQILYCRPDVVKLGNPFDTMKRFCLQSMTFFPLKVDAQKA